MGVVNSGNRNRSLFWGAMVLLNVLVLFLLVLGLDLSWWWVAAGIASFYLLLCCVLLFPQFVAPSRTSVPGVSDPKERIQLQDERLRLQNDVRGALLQAVGGTVLLIGILFTWQQLQNDRKQFNKTSQDVAEQLRLTREGQISERFRQAVDNLGGERTTEARIGGIVTLEQIAIASPQDYHQRVVGFLAGFVRSISRRPQLPDDWTLEDPLKVAVPEIQAAMDALSALNEPSRRQKAAADRPLDLTQAYLIQAQLAKTHLMGAKLDGAMLQGADLTGADLRSADLRSADLRGATLTDAMLTGASLEGALADSSTTWPAGLDPSSQGVLQIEIEIDDPTDGQRVQQQVSASGSHSGLPSGSSIWAFTRPYRISRYYPQEPCKDNSDETWTCPSVALGQPSEHGRFIIVVVIANAEAGRIIADDFYDSKLRNNFRGMSALPAGLLDRTLVTVNR
jgi:hypothetical protein